MTGQPVHSVPRGSGSSIGLAGFRQALLILKPAIMWLPANKGFAAKGPLVARNANPSTATRESPRPPTSSEGHQLSVFTHFRVATALGLGLSSQSASALGPARMERLY